MALVGGLLALAGFGGESLLAFLIGGVLFVAGCHLASTKLSDGHLVNWFRSAGHVVSPVYGGQYGMEIKSRIIASP